MKKAILFSIGLLAVSFLAFAQATITAPNGGESWVERTSHNITWTHSGANFTVKLQLFQGETRIGVIRFGLDLTADSYTWADVGLLEDGTRAPAGVGYTVRILRQSDNTLLDQSNAGFSITTPPAPTADLTLLAPNGGESWAIGGPSQNIRWSSTGLTGTVRLILFQGGTAESNRLGEIEDGLAVNGSYSWTVGSYQGGTATAGSGFYIRVRSESSETADVSERPFSLTAAAPTTSLSVTSPNGGEAWELSSSHPITWSANNVSGYVSLILLKDGAEVGTIASGLSASRGSHTWTHVGDYRGDRALADGGYRIRVQHSSGTPADTSNGDFTITAAGGGSGNDLTISDPYLQSYGSGHGFRVKVTSLNSDINEWVDIQTYCMKMGLGNAKHDRRRVELRRGESAWFNLQNMDPHLWDNECGLTFSFTINGGTDGPHDVTEVNYDNNFVTKEMFWVHDDHDGRVFQEVRLGNNYIHAKEFQQPNPVIRPGDCTGYSGDQATFYVEISLQNCGAESTPAGTVRVLELWRTPTGGGLQASTREIGRVAVPAMEPGHFNILRPAVTMHRDLQYAELMVEYDCGESGSRNDNNKFHCHPGFEGF